MRYENEKAPAGVAALAEAWKDDFAVNHSVPNFITSVGKSLHIFDFLQTGAENGVTLRRTCGSDRHDGAAGADSKSSRNARQEN